MLKIGSLLIFFHYLLAIMRWLKIIQHWCEPGKRIHISLQMLVAYPKWIIADLQHRPVWLGLIVKLKQLVCCLFYEPCVVCRWWPVGVEVSVLPLAAENLVSHLFILIVSFQHFVSLVTDWNQLLPLILGPFGFSLHWTGLCETAFISIARSWYPMRIFTLVFNL